MLGFYFDADGSKVMAEVIRRQEFEIGTEKMAMRSRGVVELSDGTVRSFSVLNLHAPNIHGHTKTVGGPLKMSFEVAVDSMRRIEGEWITDTLPLYVRDQSILPLDTKLQVLVFLEAFPKLKAEAARIADGDEFTYGDDDLAEVVHVWLFTSLDDELLVRRLGVDLRIRDVAVRAMSEDKFFGIKWSEVREFLLR